MKSLYGRYFDHTNVETADVLDNYSPDDESLWEKDALIRLPGGVELSPSGIEVTLIGVYALAGGRMDLLLEALHPDPSSVDAKTWEEIRQCIEGSRPDDKKDSLKVLARQFATWVRGSKVGTGRRPSLSEMDHSVELKASELAEEATLTAPERVKYLRPQAYRSRRSRTCLQGCESKAQWSRSAKPKDKQSRFALVSRVPTYIGMERGTPMIPSPVCMSMSKGRHSFKRR
jgi:hypothetical protein